jgi:hypothetical protein
VSSPDFEEIGRELIHGVPVVFAAAGVFKSDDDARLFRFRQQFPELPDDVIEFLTLQHLAFAEKDCDQNSGVQVFRDLDALADPLGSDAAVFQAIDVELIDISCVEGNAAFTGRSDPALLQ